MPKRKNKFQPKPSDLVPSDEYATDDSFCESQRRKVSSDTSKARLEQYDVTLRLLEAQKAALPGTIDRYGRAIDFDKYSKKLEAQVNSQYRRLYAESSKESSADMPAKRRRTPKKGAVKRAGPMDLDYIPESSESDDDVTSPKGPTPPPKRRSPREKVAKASSPKPGSSTVTADDLDFSNLSEVSATEDKEDEDNEKGL